MLTKLQSLISKNSSRKVKPLTPKSSCTTALSYTTFHIDWTMMVPIASKNTLKNIMKQDITTTFNKAFNHLWRISCFYYSVWLLARGVDFCNSQRKQNETTDVYRLLHLYKHIACRRVWTHIPIYTVVPSFCLHQALLFNTFPTIPSFKDFKTFLEQLNHQSSVILMRSDSMLICSLYPGSVYKGEWRAAHQSLLSQKDHLFKTSIEYPTYSFGQICSNTFRS